MLDVKSLLKMVYMIGDVEVTEYANWPQGETIIFQTKRSSPNKEKACVSSKGGIADEITDGDAVLIPSFKADLKDEAVRCAIGAANKPCHLHIVNRGNEVAVFTYDTECEPGRPEPKPLPQTPPTDTGLITIDEFFKAKMVTATIMSAEPHPKADRLMVLQVQIGDSAAYKQIVAGIRQHYTAEQLVGKTIIVVNNLVPTKLRGVDSNGMLLAVRTPDGGLRLLTTDGPAGSGLEVG